VTLKTRDDKARRLSSFQRCQHGLRRSGQRSPGAYCSPPFASPSESVEGRRPSRSRVTFPFGGSRYPASRKSMMAGFDSPGKMLLVAEKCPPVSTLLLSYALFFCRKLKDLRRVSPRSMPEQRHMDKHAAYMRCNALQAFKRVQRALPWCLPIDIDHPYRSLSGRAGWTPGTERITVGRTGLV
jgi:hypothetical protein